MHKETIWDSIVGVNREIHLREQTLVNMRTYLKNPSKSSAQYSMRYIYENGPKIARELFRLKVIRVELFYLYNLKTLGF